MSLGLLPGNGRPPSVTFSCAPVPSARRAASHWGTRASEIFAEGARGEMHCGAWAGKRAPLEKFPPIYFPFHPSPIPSCPRSRPPSSLRFLLSPPRLLASPAASVIVVVARGRLRGCRSRTGSRLSVEKSGWCRETLASSSAHLLSPVFSW